MARRKSSPALDIIVPVALGTALFWIAQREGLVDQLLGVAGKRASETSAAEPTVEGSQTAATGGSGLKAPANNGVTTWQERHDRDVLSGAFSGAYTNMTKALAAARAGNPAALTWLVKRDPSRANIPSVRQALFG